MARKTNGTPTRARRVSIPAGHEYVTFKPGETIYIPGTDGKVPNELTKAFDACQERAYEKGLNEGAATQDRNMRQYTLEEALQHILTTMRQYSAKDQNQILAVVISEMGKAYDTRIKALAADVAHVQGLLAETESVAAGFAAIKNGGFDLLKIS